MKLIKLFALLLTVAILASCTGPKKIASTIKAGDQALETGNAAFALKNYMDVINYYESHGKQKECPVYEKAGRVALSMEQTEQGIDYLNKNKLTPFVTDQTYWLLAGQYRRFDNLSKEMDELESLVIKFPESKDIDRVNERLFELYVESDNNEKAITIWNVLPDEKSQDETLLDNYFVVNRKMGDDSNCDILANKLLQLDENNLNALLWNGKKYFWKAENLYQSELKAYEKNKTNKQYKKLLNALDIVSADFKTSLSYFKKLYSVEPEPQYAKYLGNIYNRLDDKKKADYYYRLAGDK